MQCRCTDVTSSGESVRSVAADYRAPQALIARLETNGAKRPAR
jgi:hypothetical protein